MKKRFVLLILTMILTMSLTGCWSSREINQLTFATALGFDKSPQGVMITMQVLNPTAIASKKQTPAPTVFAYVGEGKDVFDAASNLAKQNPYFVNLSHIKLIVFSEEIAMDGISDILDYLARESRLRTDFYFTVAEGTTANHILTALSASDNVPAFKLFDLLKDAESSWSTTKTVRIIELISDITAEGIDPVIPGVVVLAEKTEQSSTDALKTTTADSALRLDNLAVFRGNQLVGWLNSEETKGFNYIIDNVSLAEEYVELPDGGRFSFSITKATTKRKAYLLNEEPAIDIEIKVEANIRSQENKLDVTKQETYDMLSSLLEDRIAYLCNSTIGKLQREWKSDIFGFGETIHRTYPKLWKKRKDNWYYEFTNLPVTLHVLVEIEQPGGISKSFFVKEKE